MGLLHSGGRWVWPQSESGKNWEEDWGLAPAPGRGPAWERLTGTWTLPNR